jgi:hypothetical protein
MMRCLNLLKTLTHTVDVSEPDKCEGEQPDQQKTAARTVFRPFQSPPTDPRGDGAVRATVLYGCVG